MSEGRHVDGRVMVRSGEFFGRSRQKWSGRGLHLEVSDFDQDLSVPKHQHQNAYICAVINGVCEERETAFDRCLEPSSVTLYCPGSEHSDYWKQKGRCLLIEVGNDLWARFAEFGPIPTCVTTHGECGSIASRIHAEFLLQDPLAIIGCEGLVVWLLAKMTRPTPLDARPPRWLLIVREQLVARIADGVAITDLAREAGVHPAHLTASFRKHFGETVCGFLSGLRVDSAARLLADGQLSIGEIAAALGFADQSHLCRAFKRRFGMPPSEYRRRVS